MKIEDKTLNNNEMDIDFFELYEVLVVKKKSLFLLSIFIFLLSASLTLLINDKYTSSALLSPVEGSESGLSKIGQYSGLASMAGITLPGSDASKSDYAIATIQSKVFFQNLLLNNGLLEAIYASKSYDKQTKSINYDQKIFSNGKWVESDGFFGFLKKEKPSYLKAHSIFINEILAISKDKETGFINVSITHQSPVFAKDLLDLIISEANNLERLKELDNADTSLEFLNIEASKNTILNTEDAITNLIEEKLNIKMLANSTEDYLLEYIDVPFYPEKKSGPKRILITIAITLISIILYSFFIIFTYFLSIRETRHLND